MEIKEGEYMFTCYPMPWTESDMGKGIGTIEMSVPISLTKEEIQGIIGMYL